MATIKDEAHTFESKQVKNIADLNKVDVSMEIYDAEASDDQGEKFTYKYVELNGIQYRVPKTVIKSIKAILVDKPDLKYFKVIKTGEGLKTQYTVVPLD